MVQLQMYPYHSNNNLCLLKTGTGQITITITNSKASHKKSSSSARTHCNQEAESKVKMQQMILGVDMRGLYPKIWRVECTLTLGQGEALSTCKIRISQAIAQMKIRRTDGKKSGAIQSLVTALSSNESPRS